MICIDLENARVSLQPVFLFLHLFDLLVKFFEVDVAVDAPGLVGDAAGADFASNMEALALCCCLLD